MYFRCLLLLLVASQITSGAEIKSPIRDFVVRSWGRAEGLPSDSVSAVLQTRDGFLWVGTRANLARFDGVKFLEISLPTAETNTPVEVTALEEDSDGNLWVGTHQDGLFCLKPTGVKTYRKASGLLDDTITSLAADTHGRVWVGTRRGLNRWDGAGFTAFTSRDGLADEVVSSVHVARSGVVWITTRDGVYQFKADAPAGHPEAGGRIAPYTFQPDSQGRRPEFLGVYEDRRGNLWAFGDTYLINLAVEKRYNYFRGMDATAMRIWSLCEGSDGRLWIGTSGRGLICFDENRFQPVQVNEPRWPNDVRAICEDREGSLWLGTSGGGLLQLLPQPVQVLRADQGVPTGAATCLTADFSGRIFAGFETGGLFAGEAEHFDRFPRHDGLSRQNLVSSLRTAPDQTLWIATLGNGLYGIRDGRSVHFTTLNGLSDNSIPAICLASNETSGVVVCAGTRAGMLHCIAPSGITTFGPEHGLPSVAITALLASRPQPAAGSSAASGTTSRPARLLWVGTEDGRVLRQQGTRFVTVHKFAPMAEASAVGPILALHEDLRGHVWIGSAGNGLACWTGQQCLTWTTRNGLPDENVYGVIEDAGADLWLLTGDGIFRVPRESVQGALLQGEPLRAKLVFAAKRVSNRLPTYGWPRALSASDGRLWFATANGLIAVDRAGPDSSRASPPPVYLETILLNGRALHPDGPKLMSGPERVLSAAARLPADVQSLEFQVTAPSFVSPERIQFRYQLEGLDRDWVSGGTERHIRYGRLPYGDYRFRAAASQADGMWSETAAPFAFTVPTPLWRTPAALALYVLGAVALVAGVVRVISTRRFRAHLVRLEQQRVVERERMRIAQDMHDDIGSKLTKISFLSERAKLEARGQGAVAGQIASIAATSRELLQTLDEIVWAVNPHNDSLEHLAAYLSHYAVEYFQNTSVECELRLPRDLPPAPLSAESRHNLFLAFEEVLNNTLKHSRATKVSIAMATGVNDFQIEVTDNGKGFMVAAAERPADAKSGGGNGLANMRHRLSVVGGQCVIRSQPGAGTSVTLRIPLNAPAPFNL